MRCLGRQLGELGSVELRASGLCMGANLDFIQSCSKHVHAQSPTLPQSCQDLFGMATKTATAT